MKKLQVAAAISLATLMVVGACKKQKPTASGRDSKGVAERMKSAENLPDGAFFAHIPAGAPYVLASFEPVPSEVFESMMAPQGMLWETVLTNAKAEADGSAKVLEAIKKELEGKMNADGLKSLGISTSPQFALYGLGPLPVVRVSLEDGAKLQATVERIAKNADKTVPWKALGDIKYLEQKEGELTFVFAILPKSAVMGMFSPDAAADALPHILGKSLPKESMKGGGALKDVVAKHGFRGYGVGFVDFGRLLQAATGKESGELRKYWEALSKGDWMSVPGPCMAHLETMANDWFPRVVLGYNEFSKGHMSFSLFLEMKEMFAKAVSGTSFPARGVSSSALEGALFGMATGVDLTKTKALASTAAPFLEQLSKDCNENDFSDMAVGLREFAEMPPQDLVGNQVAGSFAAMDLDVDIENKRVNEAAAFAMVHLEQPKKALQQLAGLAKGAGVELDAKADGKWHPQTIPMLAMIGNVSVFLSIRDKYLMLAIGEKGKTAADAAYAKDEGAGALAVVSYDMARLAKFAEQIPQGASPSEKDIIEGLAKSWSALGSTQMSFHTTANGVGMTVTSSMASTK